MSYDNSGQNKFASLSAKITTDGRSESSAPKKRGYTDSQSLVSPSTGARDNRYQNKDRGFKGGRKAPTHGRQNDRHVSGTGRRTNKRSGNQKHRDENQTEEDLTEDSAEGAEGEEAAEEVAAPTVTYDQFEEELAGGVEVAESRERRGLGKGFDAISSKRNHGETISLEGRRVRKTRASQKKRDAIDVSPIVTSSFSSDRPDRQNGNRNNGGQRKKNDRSRGGKRNNDRERRTGGRGQGSRAQGGQGRRDGARGGDGARRGGKPDESK